MKIDVIIAGALLALYAAWPRAAPLEPGSAWPALMIEDQHGKPARFDAAQLTTVVFAAERQPGDWAQEVIEQTHAEAAIAGRLALILDVSRMPAMITKMFALPAWRARAFPILVAREAAPVADLPRRAGAVTVLRLAAGKVGAVDYAFDAEALAVLLDTPFPPPQSGKETR